jgi:hypothetical protein
MFSALYRMHFPLNAEGQPPPIVCFVPLAVLRSTNTRDD